jgi:diguanylate cyclase (GGDEF)-like protein
MLQIYFIGKDEEFADLKRISRFETASYHHYTEVEFAILNFQRNPLPLDAIGLILISDSLSVEPEKACRALMALPAMDNVPLLLLISSRDEAPVERYLNAGVFDIIQKPLNARDLFCRFESAFRMRYLIRRRMYQEERLMHYRKLVSGQPVEESGGMDALTGLYNRKFFDSYSEMEWNKSVFLNGNFSILVINIDGFSNFIETYGNRIGDDALLKVVDVIRKNLRRPGDIAVRFQGDQIVCVISDTDLMGAKGVAERMRSDVYSMQIPNVKSSITPLLTVSVGVASAPAQRMESWNEIYEMSIKALERAKKSGNTVAD